MVSRRKRIWTTSPWAANPNAFSKYGRFRKDRDLWEVDYWDGEGVRRRPMFQTEEQAHEHASGVLRVQGGLPAAGVYREIRLRDFAAQWLVQIEVDKELATVRGYAASLTGHVIPALGHLRLRELQRAHIKAFLAEKRRSGYAKNTVRLMKAAL